MQNTGLLQPNSLSRTSSVLAEGDGWRLRCAGDEDQAALVELLETVPFGAPARFVEHRGEDILALRRAQLAGFPTQPTAFILESLDGVPIGCFTISVRARPRPGTIVERPALGIVGDLRLRPGSRAGQVLPEALARAVDHTRLSHAVDYFSTAVVSSDIYSLAPFLRREPHRYAQPMAQVVARLVLAYVPLGGSYRHRTERNHQWAHREDREELIDFLLRTQAGRRFGILHDDPLLTAREQSWPSFSVERFYVVRGRDGQVVACGAPWDPGPLRHLCRQPRAGLPIVSQVADRWGPVGKIPSGRPLGLVYLTHLCCDPASMGPAEDLVRGVCNALSDEGHDGLVVMTPADGAVHRALQGMSATCVSASILGLTAAGTAQNANNLRATDVGLEAVFL